MQKTRFQMLNDDEIVTSVQESEPVDDETDEDEDNSNESSKGPSNADAFLALETAMQCLSQYLLPGHAMVEPLEIEICVTTDEVK
ncbi:hypothetical protein TNCV_1954741 [Trichonephila clavipes]|nr:hypothetical protein TNCV_1954741 [Trichonephila clavipes]